MHPTRDWLDFNPTRGIEFFPVEKAISAWENGLFDEQISTVQIVKQHVSSDGELIEEKVDLRCANGASLGLQTPYLKGNEVCELINIHPKHARFRFQLPNERPSIWTDGRNGKLNLTNPVIHTVIIEPNLSRLSIVWRGASPALRPYLPEELKSMPYRVDW